VLNQGRLIQVGSPSDLVRAPADDYVAQLMSAPRRDAAAVDALITGSEGS
jgi:osmoprotectant transport system ATP-binding protein